MLKTSMMISALAVLAACGDPLDGFNRISDVDLGANDSAAQALPTEAEISREGFFGAEVTEGQTAAVSGISDPPDLSAGGPVAQIAPVPRQRSLFGLLRSIVPTPQPEPAAITEQSISADTAAASVLPALDGGAQDAQVSDITAGPDVPVVNAALDGTNPSLPVLQQPKRRGLFGGLSAPKTAAASSAESPLREVEYGTIIPYGEVARSCAAKRKVLGRKIEKTTASGHTIYDSNPNSTQQRTFYITGFDDGCPRQLTAAHVLSGAPSFYELLHYGPTGQHLTSGETDLAYEKVKGRVCGVAKGKPCGANMKKLERSTLFVNSYPQADDNTNWSEMLLHEDKIVATASKDNS
ncbi:MAG: hypothetical protein ABJL67_13060 [Sulfitobacter sp.]